MKIGFYAIAALGASLALAGGQLGAADADADRRRLQAWAESEKMVELRASVDNTPVEEGVPIALRVRYRTKNHPVELTLGRVLSLGSGWRGGLEVEVRGKDDEVLARAPREGEDGLSFTLEAGKSLEDVIQLPLELTPGKPGPYKLHVAYQMGVYFRVETNAKFDVVPPSARTKLITDTNKQWAKLSDDQKFKALQELLRNGASKEAEDLVLQQSRTRGWGDWSPLRKRLLFDSSLPLSLRLSATRGGSSAPDKDTVAAFWKLLKDPTQDRKLRLEVVRLVPWTTRIARNTHVAVSPFHDLMKCFPGKEDRDFRLAVLVRYAGPDGVTAEELADMARRDDDPNFRALALDQLWNGAQAVPDWAPRAEETVAALCADRALLSAAALAAHGRTYPGCDTVGAVATMLRLWSKYKRLLESEPQEKLIAALGDLLRGGDADAATMLGRIGLERPEAVIPALTEALGDKREDVRLAVAAALKKIKEQPPRPNDTDGAKPTAP